MSARDAQRESPATIPVQEAEQMSDIENSVADQPWRWRKGQSGNPAGKPKGARHRMTRAAETLLDGEAQNLTRKAVELALAGDTTALRLCLERVLPALKSRPINLDLPAIGNAQDLGPAFNAVLDGLAGGALLLDEATAVVGILEAKRRAIETSDIEKRLAALEERSMK
jgi:hypothetical protein